MLGMHGWSAEEEGLKEGGGGKDKEAMLRLRPEANDGGIALPRDE